ncbi:ribonuclease H-like domain-containing protein [Tanacetum coccineum]
MDNVRPRALYSPIKRSYYTKLAFRPKNLKQDGKTSRVKNVTTAGTRAVVNTGKGQSRDLVTGSCSGGYDPKGGKITGKGKIRTANLDFDNVYFVDEPLRQNDVYSLDLKNIVPSGGLENQLNHKVKIIRCDHGIEFKNHAMNEFCANKGIKRKFSLARTPQQNGVAKRKNRTLIEAARTMLADSLLPIPFWAEAVNIACYMKDIYLDTLLLVRLFRVYNKRTKRVEESLHINFLEDQPNMVGSGPDWMFDLDFLTNTMNYILVSIENQATSINKLNADRPSVSTANTPYVSTNTPYVSAASTPIGANDGESSFVYLGGQIPIDASTLPNANLSTDPNMPDLEDDSDVFPKEGIFSGAYNDEDKGAEADFNNMDNTIDVNPIPTLRIHKDHLKAQILGDPKSAVQTRRKIQKASSSQ